MSLIDFLFSVKELPERWNSIKKLAWSVKHEVAPLQNAEVAVIRKKYVAFEVCDDFLLREKYFLF